MVGDPALVEDQDGIVKLEVGKGVGHGKHNPALAAGDIVKEMNDFPFGTGIKPTGDLVAKKEFGVGN